ncbi:aminopeptidase 2 [Clostridium pasteurianum DSM 525 = ATCC 6013]|uniref:Aminopeptidase 2 n=1 Tax=Clostridium pasteurianum DSM 525 = ATCC 6013 TaxID=1262449 RepID=A0A0H3J454_CLOPA|nr:aminopeptidase [Clostridium pasteurianum]AJA48254.1 aminopeptidase 2 [Clostridium pasteurianum DSM 525 = ATCC 6013]AJA52242.1 aminopeptidase 2 [Clostridium pasteurianum DSM 525 = ATCC 6013]AOZ75509.1 peptidase M29 [Clostridium pasteurianum DSM 525 = ATCC 6013]AOZ79304.1 peptidase M29 [Clostridium pasteurianum]ELP60596.1 aminopeptidase [Clostridium pasteurianum DSM 525 = ATCC 6013]
MNYNILKKYAELIVKQGINIQKNQILVINSPIECAEFTRKVSEIAYKEGAKDVVVSWNDELLSKIKYLNAPDEVFKEFPSWRKELYVSYAKEGAAFLSISASDPELMKDVNPERLMKANKASSVALKDYRERLMSDKNVWCVVSVPTKAWAKKVFPGTTEGIAVEKLWNAIFKAVRADVDNPVAAWEEHKNNLNKSMDFLNKNNFKYLEYKNSLGTDLKIELPENHIWLGGSSYTPEYVEFIANIPTEEVFTLPKKTGVNGIVVSSKPLNYRGNLIEKFSITFKDGEIVDFTADKGYDTLKSLIDTDEGSKYLGEVALVPYNSPISNSNILFYNTLFDENASCHLAIGKAYPVCVKNGEEMSADELKAIGVNDSIEHVDFMIGTEDLNITGIKDNGDKITVFENGNFKY